MRFRSWLLRSALAILATSLVSTTALNAQEGGGTSALSERVGPTLDSLEIAYFGLFPRNGAVRAAAIGRTAEGQLRLELDLADRDDTVLVLDAVTERGLVRYIEEYERMQTGDEPYITDAVAPYRLQPVLSGDGAVRVETIDGRTISGMLLHVDERGIIVLPGTDQYDWRRVPVDAVAVAAASIERIVVDGPVSMAVLTGVSTVGALGAFLYVNADDRPSFVPISLAIVFGGLFAGSATSLFSADHPIEGELDRYLARRAAIASERFFSDIEPPELRGITDRALASALAALPPTPPDRSFATLASKRISVAVNATAAATNAGSSYVVHNLDTRKNDTVEASLAGLGFGAEVSYDLSSWLEIGLGVNYRAASPETARQHESIEELGGMATASVNLMPRRALGRSELELLVGVGVGLSRMALNGVVLDLSGGSTEGASMVSALPTVQGRAQARFNLFGNLSLHVVGIGQWYPSLNVPEYSSQFPTTREEVRRVDEHEVALSGLHMQVGLRYWF